MFFMLLRCLLVHSFHRYVTWTDKGLKYWICTNVWWVVLYTRITIRKIVIPFWNYQWEASTCQTSSLWYSCPPKSFVKWCLLSAAAHSHLQIQKCLLHVFQSNHLNISNKNNEHGCSDLIMHIREHNHGQISSHDEDYLRDEVLPFPAPDCKFPEWLVHCLSVLMSDDPSHRKHPSKWIFLR